MILRKLNRTILQSVENVSLLSFIVKPLPSVLVGSIDSFAAYRIVRADFLITFLLFGVKGCIF